MRVDLLELLHPHTPAPDPLWRAPASLKGVRRILRALRVDARCVALRVALCMAADEYGGLAPDGYPPSRVTARDGRWLALVAYDHPQWFWMWWEPLPREMYYSGLGPVEPLAVQVLRGTLPFDVREWFLAETVRECGVLLDRRLRGFYREWWDRCRCVLAFADAPRADLQRPDFRTTLQRAAALRLPTEGCPV